MTELFFGVGVFHSLAFHCKTLNMARQARKNTNLVENVKEINQWYYTCKIGVRVIIWL
jgi:hypothetical protein